MKIKYYVSFIYCVYLLSTLSFEVWADSSEMCKPLAIPSDKTVSVRTVWELENAVTSAIPGTTILVEDGVYHLTKPLMFVKDSVSLRSKSGDRDKVFLRGKGMTSSGPPHVITIYASDIVVADVTLGMVPFHGIQIHGENGAMRPRMHNIHILDCGQQLIKVSAGSGQIAERKYSDEGELACSFLEYTNHAPSGYTNGIDVLAGKGWVVRDNKFVRIRGPEGQLSGPAILFWQNCIDTIAERNLLVECSRGIAFGNPGGSNTKYSRNGEKTFDHQGGVVRNNIIVKTSGGDTGIEFNRAKDFKCYHNTVYVYSSSVNWAIECRFPESSGIIKNNMTNMRIIKRDSGHAVLEGNITYAQDNWFVNVKDGDLHLTESAKEAINRTPPVTEVVDDFDGQLRPKEGGGYDIGADEK